MGAGLKREDWRERLHDYLQEWDEKEFSWNTHSCLHFATGAVTVMTGMDYWWIEREKLKHMKNRGQVLRYMTEFGGDLVGATRKVLSRARFQPRHIPGEGDVVIAVVDGVQCVGICLGRLTAFISKQGVVYIDPKEIVAAWKVD